MSKGIYLFCLLPAATPVTITGKGIDGEHPLSLETIGDVAAIFSEINTEDFSGPAAKKNLEDLAWVAPRALRHEEVVLAAMAQGPVLPVRFGMVFSSLAAAESLRCRQEVLTGYFRNTEGKHEWTIKGYADRPLVRARMTTVRLAEQQEQLAGLSPGKRYVLEQKIKGTVDKDLTSWLQETARDILYTTREVSDRFSGCRLQSREVTGRDDEMFFHGALLVPGRFVPALQQRTQEWNLRREAGGLRMELSGPWPPYHFAPVL